MNINKFTQDVCSEVVAACAGHDIGQQQQDALFNRVYDYLANSMTGAAVVEFGDVSSCTPALFRAVSEDFSMDQFDKMILSSKMLTADEPTTQKQPTTFLKLVK